MAEGLKTEPLMFMKHCLKEYKLGLFTAAALGLPLSRFHDSMESFLGLVHRLASQRAPLETLSLGVPLTVAAPSRKPLPAFNPFL